MEQAQDQGIARAIIPLEERDTEEEEKEQLTHHDPATDEEVGLLLQETPGAQEQRQIPKQQQTEQPVGDTPLPMDKMICIILLTANESFSSMAIFAYVGYMVLDFGLTSDKSEIG